MYYVLCIMYYGSWIMDYGLWIMVLIRFLEKASTNSNWGKNPSPNKATTALFNHYRTTSIKQNKTTIGLKEFNYLQKI